MLEISRYLFSLQQNLRLNAALFVGKNQYRWYYHLFLNIIEEYEVDFKEIGVNPGDLVAHICIKVVPTIVSADCKVCPPIISLFIRYVWSMGVFKEICFKYEAYGYQYVFHCSSSLDKNIIFFDHHRVVPAQDFPFMLR